MLPESSGRTLRRYGRLGKYELVAHVATGGMGVVYQGVDEETGHEVALKILSPALAVRPISLARFRREADFGTRLRHENIASIYSFNEANGTYFLVMEWIDGINLHDYIIANGPLDLREACEVLTQAAQALDYLHHQGLVHRDIKPSNFLLIRRDDHIQVKLTDLGLAREIKDGSPAVDEHGPETLAETEPNQATSSDEALLLTQAGKTVGTLDYIAPEQARDSRRADIRSDLYALGCSFYHMLAGRPPFVEGGGLERLVQHQDMEPIDIRQLNPEVPAAVVSVLRRMLAKKPAERYQTPAELLRDLEFLARGEFIEFNCPPLPVAAAEQAAPMADGRTARPTAPLTTVWNAAETFPASQDSSSSLPGQTADLRQVAAGQFERAKEALNAASLEYAVHLMLSCCKLDPAQLLYRQTLRRLVKTHFPGQRRRGRFGRLVLWTGKARLKAALRTGDYRKVLEHGEDLLTRDPTNKEVAMAMAEAARELGLPKLAVWILEQAWDKRTHTPALDRALGLAYEARGHFPQAMASWQLVLAVRPNDLEAHRKLKDLAARETIVRGQYEEVVRERYEQDAPRPQRLTPPAPETGW